VSGLARAVTPFCVEADVDGCSAEVYLNDIPLGRLFPEPGNPELGLTINQLIRNGPNTVELLLDPGDHPSAARTPKETRDLAGLSFFLRVSRVPEGGVIGESAPSETLVEVNFTGDGMVVPVPLSAVRTFTVDSPFPPWAWERAEVLTLGPALTADVVAFLADYRAALAHRDIGRENRLSALVHAEICAAYGRSPGPWVAALNGAIEDEWRRADWSVEPIDADQLDLRLCANGRMVQCVRKDWDDAIRSNRDAEGGNMTVPLFLGRLDGRMQRLR
jgi:hypothetical protein